MVNVSPDARTITPPPGAVRTCTSCKHLRSLGDFALIDPGKGTIDRRRICTPCIERVDGLLQAGERNISAINRQTGVSPETIRQRRDELGVERPSHRRLDDIDALVELTLADTPVADIAAQLGVEDYTVRRRQVALGLRESTPRAPISAERLARAERMLREDQASYLETARTVSVDVDTLRRRFPGLGWTSDDRASMAAVLAKPDLKRLHEEFFGHAAAG